MEIKDFNEWWKTGNISEDYKKLNKRFLFEEILKYLKYRQIIVITGLRRVGKTILIHHIINHLLQNNIKDIIKLRDDLARELHPKELPSLITIFAKADNKQNCLTL